MGIDTFVALLPWLAILACPAMMLLMMRGMSGGGCHSSRADERNGEEPLNKGAGLTASEEIQALRARLEALEDGLHQRNVETEEASR